MNRKRLNYLAIELVKNALNPKGAKFDLTAWYHTLNQKKPISCGTTACAFGFAALLPEFKKQGLQQNGGAPFIMSKTRPDPTLERYTTATTVNGYRVTGFGAAAVFFDISIREAQELFNPANYRFLAVSGSAGEMAVATKIVELLSEGAE